MPIDPRFRSWTVAVLAVPLLLPTLACSTGGRSALPPPGTPLPAPVELDADPLERNPDLLLLQGRFCEVFYVPGSLDRAAALQQRLDLFVEALMAIVPGICARRSSGWRILPLASKSPAPPTKLKRPAVPARCCGPEIGHFQIALSMIAPEDAVMRAKAYRRSGAGNSGLISFLLRGDAIFYCHART